MARMSFGAKRGPKRGAPRPVSSIRRTTRCRWPAHGASSSTISSSVPRARPVKRVHHPVLDVVVADAHRVRMAERALRGLGRRPLADAGDQPQPGEDGRRRVDSSSRRADGRGGADRSCCRLMSTPIRCQSQVGMSRNTCGAGGTRIGTGCRPGRRRAVPQQQHAPRPPRLHAGDLLLEDGGHQRVDDQAGRAQPHARTRPQHLRQRGIARATSTAVQSSSAPSSAGTRSSSQAAPSPHACGRHHRAARRTAPACRIAVRGRDGPPEPAVDEAVRRVALAAHERHQRRAQVDRAAGVPLAVITRARSGSGVHLGGMRVLESAFSQPPTP